MLGVKRNNRDSVHGPESCLAPNIGLEELEFLHDSQASKTHTRLGGVIHAEARLKVRFPEDDI